MEFVSRGNRLHYRRWWVEGALGAVVIAHGLGEHSGRYRQLARQLNCSGFSVYALDHYGHGLSEGPRGHIDDFAHYSEDLHHFIRLVKRDNAGCGLHLLGHSMGGVIACGCAVRYGGIDSLILSAPGFRGCREPGSLERWLAQRLAVLAPRLTLPNRIDPRWLSRDSAVVEDYRADDLVHGRVSLQWFVSFLRERDYLYPRLPQITEPCLLLLPEADKVVDAATSRAWFERLGSGNKQLHVFPDAYHEVFNEAEEGPRARELLLQHLELLLPMPAAAVSR
ncbi:MULTISPECIES: alpha/beta hydrolase [unclassified Microbulbifer]|uniref:alpha/beta hydrolase n=1 Tax=unclassified Microbulbifer TaxID=2619833 RepID=UPI0027E526F6|nr:MULTISPECIES: alpha/beta hydrolase [unclassified Microbulbifer]